MFVSFVNIDVKVTCSGEAAVGEGGVHFLYAQLDRKQFSTRF